jgi:hypothetical protein
MHTVCEGKAMKYGTVPSRGQIFPVPVGIASRHTANAILRQAGLPKAF